MRARAAFWITPKRVLSVAAAVWAAGLAPGVAQTIRLRGEVMDERTRQPLPCRVYLRGEDGQWHFPKSAAAAGSAVPYKKQNWLNTNAVEMHTTLSAHPFEIDLPRGRYTVTVEHGKEYVAQTRVANLAGEPVELRFPLRRWINLADRGWYCGDTHVHRSLEELPNVMLAEDLNVSFPLLYWVTRAYTPPSRGDKNTAGTLPDAVIRVDDTHAICSRNTEYEIFTVNGQSHTLGAVFVLNHRSVFEQGAPPLRPIAERAHQEGALLDMDKHDWPWAMALAPILQVDLFELANNHVWRTEFGFTNWSSPAPAYMGLPNQGRSGQELDWLLYGFQNYYALLNCGFRLRPTAGTASGVHPVPLGFSRVYVHLGKKFSCEEWVKGLNEGRSFVTTGPMLFATLEKQLPGHVFKQARPRETYTLAGMAVYEHPLARIELVVNGEVAATINARNKRTGEGAYESPFKESFLLDRSAWLAVRCFEEPVSGRARFAHTAPFYVEVAGQPVRPRPEEVAFLSKRVEEQIARSRGVLAPEAIAEYEQALAFYQDLARRAQ